MKLSEQIKQCIDGNGCAACDYMEYKITHTCEGLLQEAYEQVKKYEDMFPCEVGDTVYYPVKTQNRIVEFEITQIQIFKDEIVFFDDSDNMYHVEDFGKIIFITKEQAEAALREMNGREDESHENE